MLCLSHSGTIRLIDRISQDYDIDVQYWSDALLEDLKVKLCTCTQLHGLISHQLIYCSVVNANVVPVLYAPRVN